MKYTVRVTEKARKQIESLDRPTRLILLKWMKKHLDGCEDPFLFGHALTGDKTGFWTYRSGDYRIIARIEKGELLILVVEVGHRSKVYQ